MKMSTSSTIHEDAEYAEICRVQNDLAAKRKTIGDALETELQWAQEREQGATRRRR